MNCENRLINLQTHIDEIISSYGEFDSANDGLFLNLKEPVNSAIKENIALIRESIADNASLTEEIVSLFQLVNLLTYARRYQSAMNILKKLKSRAPKHMLYELNELDDWIARSKSNYIKKSA